MIKPGLDAEGTAVQSSILRMPIPIIFGQIFDKCLCACLYGKSPYINGEYMAQLYPLSFRTPLIISRPYGEALGTRQGFEFTNTIFKIYKFLVGHFFN